MDLVPKSTLPPAADVLPAYMAGLETERLFLRPLDRTMQADWLTLHRDEEVSRFVVGPPLTEADAWRDLAFVIGHAVLRGFSMWAVIEKSSNAFIGRVGPWLPEGWPGLEIGWALSSAGRGKGYGAEGVEASLRWTAEHLRVSTAIHSIHPDNAASKMLAQKIGADLLGTADISGELHEVWVSRLKQ